jgi:hypothetical protein
MKTKIFIIFVGLILFSFIFTNEVKAATCSTITNSAGCSSGACTTGVCTWDWVQEDACYCQVFPTSTPRPPTSTPKPPTPTTNPCSTGTCYLNSTCSDWSLCQGSGTCGTNNNCCITCPLATATPTAIPTINYTCDDNGDECLLEGHACLCGAGTGTCQGMDVCCNICPVNTPTPTTPAGATATPTPVPCDTNNDGVCNTSDPYCTYECETTCLVDQIYREKTIYCSTSVDCPVCSTEINVSAPTQCGLCSNTTPIPTGCQPYLCYNVPPINAYCPKFDAVGYPCYGEGNCDNCGGVDCGLCPGSIVPPVGPTPTPGCTETCFADSRWPTTCNDQTFGICGNTIWCYGNLSCQPTTLSNFEIRRSDATWSYTNSNVGGQDITDAQNRLHICDSFLSDESPNPRSVVYVAWLNNVNGWDDIDENSVYMRWLGDYEEHKMTRLGAGMEYGFYVAVSYSDLVNIASAQGFQIKMKSINGGILTDWTDVTPDLKLKVWNCQVPVSGSLYQAEGNLQSCSTNSAGLGFLLPIGNKVGFNSIVFSDTPDVNMTDDDLANYGTNNIVWGKTYHPLINGGTPANEDGNLAATGRVTRIIDLGVGTTICPGASIFSIDNNSISPYSASPRAQVDFSFIADQEAWYQVVGAGVKGKIGVESGVPVTADGVAETFRRLTMSAGLIKAQSIRLFTLKEFTGLIDALKLE